MNQKEYSPSDHVKEFLSKSKDKLIQTQNIMLMSINTFVDNGQITLAMNNMQIIQSLNISEKLLLASDKKVIRDRLARLINEALLTSSINGANAAKNAIPYQELDEIISNENNEIKENTKVMKKSISQVIKKITSITKTIISISGNISVVISGAKVIKTLSINDIYLIPKNKSLIEAEILETVNRAVQDIQLEIQEQLIKKEDEIC